MRWNWVKILEHVKDIYAQLKLSLWACKLLRVKIKSREYIYAFIQWNEMQCWFCLISLHFCVHVGCCTHWGRRVASVDSKISFESCSSSSSGKKQCFKCRRVVASIYMSYMLSCYGFHAFPLVPRYIWVNTLKFSTREAISINKEFD